MAEINVPVADLEIALKKTKSTTVFVNQVEITDLRPIGNKFWFEYHCEESPQSSHAELWYHSHQQVEVLGFADCSPAFFTSLQERGESGHQLLYKVRFNDGLECDAFEDELLDSPEHFQRPHPPNKD